MTPLVLIHVIISLIGIFTGLIVIIGMLQNNRKNFLTAVFLHTTTITSLSGFVLPAGHLLPSHIVGIISLVVLAIAYLALFRFGLKAGWRWIFIVTSIAAEFLNIFVGIVQSFLKFPFLNRLAPTQSEPPFLIAQGAAFLLLAIFAVLSIRKFEKNPVTALPTA